VIDWQIAFFGLDGNVFDFRNKVPGFASDIVVAHINIFFEILFA
jgi:hypothetical protein